MDCSKYMQDKFRQYFHFLDVNKDGFITREDFVEIGENVLKTYNAEDEHGPQMQTVLENWWSLLSPIATNGKIEEDAYVDRMKSLYEANLPENRQFTIKGISFTFDVMDRNKDNVISMEEFQIYYGLFNVKNKQLVEKIFQQVDLDGDGFITREEWAIAMVNYFTCADPRVGYAFLFNTSK